MPESVSAPSDSQPFRIALLGRPDVMPEAVTPVTVTVWVSDQSTSVNLIVPEAVSAVSESSRPARSVIEPVCALLVMTGASLVPVMVTSTFCVVVPPWLSATCTA